jgi:DNA-binding transcriptional ArsR family regulator
MAEKTRRGERLKGPLAVAVCHPVRVKCLAILGERVASPAEIGREIAEDSGNVNYHVNKLAKANLVEEVGNRRVRGATEHYFKAVELPMLTDDQESEMPDEGRKAFAENIITLYAANATSALEAGTLIGRTDHHLTRVAMNMDEEGWDEMTAAYMELYERVTEIQTTAAERMGESDEAPMRVVSFQSLFEVPRQPST